MKYRITKLTITALLSSAFAVSAVSLLFNKEVKVLEAATLPTTLFLGNNTEEDITNYYSSLSSLSDAELSGTNLLKNLKGIIANNVTYYSYSSNVPNIYTITERDWNNSPISTLGTGTYNEETETITGFKHNKEAEEHNPYIRMLYCDYDSIDKTTYSGNGDVDSGSKSFDNEHVWSQSHGFYSGSGNPLEGAGTDLHHLIAGTQYGNRFLHSNYSYGFVKANDTDWANKIATGTVPYETKNKRGEPLFAHSQDQQNKVFEPQDCDKGDIARAMLYMAACYNNLDGSTPTPAIPALNIQNYVIGDTTGYSSDNIVNGYYGILQDLLAWHRMDPVDEYEIHRNNLIYNNYQHNRNPFIDYPQWVEYIWGTAEYDEVAHTLTYDPTSTGHVNLATDVINGYTYDEAPESIEVSHLPNKTKYLVGESLDKTGLIITANYPDYTTKNITKRCSYSYDFSTTGNKVVTVTFGELTCSFDVTVVSLTNLALDSLPVKTEYETGTPFDKTGMVVIATYSDDSTENVTDRCEIVGADTSTTGTKTVTVKYGGMSVTFNIVVKSGSPTKIFTKEVLIYIGIGVGGVLLLIGLITGVVKVNKKGKVTVNKKKSSSKKRK